MISCSGGGHFGRFLPWSPLTSVVCQPLPCYGCNWECRFERVHCVVDVEPRPWGRAGLETIKAMAAELAGQLERREEVHGI